MGLDIFLPEVVKLKLLLVGVCCRFLDLRGLDPPGLGNSPLDDIEDIGAGKMNHCCCSFAQLLRVGNNFRARFFYTC
jgi:hypothetical protein